MQLPADGEPYSGWIRPFSVGFWRPVRIRLTAPLKVLLPLGMFAPYLFGLLIFSFATALEMPCDLQHCSDQFSLPVDANLLENRLELISSGVSGYAGLLGIVGQAATGHQELRQSGLRFGQIVVGGNV